MGQEGFAVFVELVAQRAEEGADFLLPQLGRLDFLLANSGVFLGAGGEVLEAAFAVLDEHVGLANGPRLIVPIRAEEHGLCIGVEVVDLVSARPEMRFGF